MILTAKQLSMADSPASSPHELIKIVLSRGHMLLELVFNSFLGVLAFFLGGGGGGGGVTCPSKCGIVYIRYA